MSLADLLQQIVGGASQPNASQLDQVTQSASKADLQGGVSAALRSDQTPDLSQIVSQMFGQASPEQQAAILNTITEKLGPGALAGVAGGVLLAVLAGWAGTRRILRTPPALALRGT